MEKVSPAIKFLPGDDRSGTHFEEHDPLTVEEIDSLCERLNAAPLNDSKIASQRTAIIDAICKWSEQTESETVSGEFQDGYLRACRHALQIVTRSVAPADPSLSTRPE